jgi:AAA-like domain
MKLHNPIQTIAGHLLFSVHGTWWTTFKLQGLPYGRRPDKDKEHIRALHQAMYRSLGGESLHLGLQVDTDPVSVVQKMLENLDYPLEQLPEWAAECEATLDRLENELPLGERTYWVSIPLRGAGSQMFVEPLRAAQTSIANTVGLPRLAPSGQLLAERSRQAEELRALIPAPFRARPATAAEQVWLFSHAVHRGLISDPWLPTAPSTPDANQPTSPAEPTAATAADAAPALVSAVHPLGSIGEPLLDEGALSDVPEDAWRKGWRQRLRQLKPAQRRVLKVIDPDQDSASYQSMLVLAGTPDGGAVFPGTEWLGNIDNAAVPVDWAVRMRNNARESVIGRNQRAVAHLNEQYEQREGEISTGSHELDAIAEVLTEYQRRLATEKLEVELETITCFATAAPTREQALEQGSRLVSWFAGFEHRLARPLGEQEEVWWAMQPGAPWPRKLQDYTQISLAEGFSAAVPMMSTVLGDGRGVPLAVNQTTLALAIVMLDLFGTIAADFSGAIAIAGELGSGKSFTMKSIAGGVCDRGGRIIAIDHSGTGEYVDFAQSLGDYEIADVLDPERSLDPLLIFPGQEGCTIARSLLTALLTINAMSPDDTLLGRVLKREYLDAHAIHGLGELTDHLITTCSYAGAQDLGHRMDAFRSEAFGKVLFDGSLPPISTTSRALVFWTHGLQLPTREELHTEHLFNQLKLEKRFGRAIYALLMSIARIIAFADDTDPVLFLADEFHRITASPEGLEEATTFVREARKQLAAIVIGSQDCDGDFGDDTLKGLIPYRLVMRLTDERLAAAALRWIGLPPTPELLEEIRTDLSPRDPNHPHGEVAPSRRGEGMFRDSHGRTGRVRILGPALEARRKAYSTTAASRRSKPGESRRPGNGRTRPTRAPQPTRPPAAVTVQTAPTDPATLTVTAVSPAPAADHAAATRVLSPAPVTSLRKQPAAPGSSTTSPTPELNREAEDRKAQEQHDEHHDDQHDGVPPAPVTAAPAPAGAELLRLPTSPAARRRIARQHVEAALARTRSANADQQREHA